MNRNLVVRKSQLECAHRILAALNRSMAPEFLGLVSTTGHPIALHTSHATVDADTLASLAASSFVATRQLSRSGGGAELTIMFQNSAGLNVHIAQISEKLLLVVCFSRKSEMGKIRLVCRRAAGILNEAMK